MVVLPLERSDDSSGPISLRTNQRRIQFSGEGHSSYKRQEWKGHPGFKRTLDPSLFHVGENLIAVHGVDRSGPFNNVGVNIINQG